jgi:hypothetical protein
VHHDLTVYALVAGAAGLSVLAQTPASEAEIVYPPADSRPTGLSEDIEEQLN